MVLEYVNSYRASKYRAGEEGTRELVKRESASPPEVANSSLRFLAL